MDPMEQVKRLTRRSFLTNSMAGLGTLALASLINPRLRAAETDGKPADKWTGVVNPLHFPAKAKRVIHLCMAGGPSHLELFDYKPKLAEMNGKPMPESITKGQPIAQLQGQALKCLGPQYPFAKYGKSQQEFTSLLPNLGKVADEICIIRSVQTEQINHDPAHTFMNTGTSISGRPSMGAWVQYGLGSECDNLPGFVVLTSSGRGGQDQPIASRQWHSGFLPSRFQGVNFRSKGDAVLYLNKPNGVSAEQQDDVVRAVQALNKNLAGSMDDPEIATRISQYEMAFKMQTSVPDLMEISKEPANILELYGTKGSDGTFAANCLLARRLAQRGVRFIQLYHRDWDHHGDIKRDIPLKCEEVDKALYALITDLKQNGMLDETLIIFGGEFGRTPMAQGSGRDHHIKGFSIFMCGGGIKGGISHGQTDDFGYNAEVDKFPVHDLHATMLRLLGIDHKRLTYKFQGRDFRLTDVHGEVVEKILA